LYLDGITEYTDYLSYLYLAKEIPLWQDKEGYHLALKNFYIPEWWYHINTLSENDKRIQKDFTKTYTIQIESGIALSPDVKDTIVIKEIRFSKSKIKPFLFLAVPFVLYFIFLVIYLLLKEYKKRMVEGMQNLIIPYTYLEIEDGQDPGAGRVIEYIIQNFKTLDLSVKKVSTACSVPVYRIPVILKEKFRLSFPGYVNLLRLNEAKRLLKETSISITDIAMTIGYNNISYFNNLFRFFEDMSPGEFRRKYKERTTGGK
jgi:AraC-like DNA-binding protein